jgi:hypothetical protein
MEVGVRVFEEDEHDHSKRYKTKMSRMIRGRRKSILMIQRGVSSRRIMEMRSKWKGWKMLRWISRMGSKTKFKGWNN